ncbi:nucleolin [Galendromus occidentalis]|uniref:Nucleolin n=1 Tax=Galendromus occidentalis TaxID=34638 RepID=A0AAJ6QP13_9ACAR|nr:nucleolin [Galendromus occidentalis]
MPPQKTKAKKNVPAKVPPAKQKKLAPKEVSEDEDDDDDEDIDEDDIDEDVSVGSLDEDEDLDDEDGSDDLDEEEDDDDEDDEKEEEPMERPAKRAKLNGKDDSPVKVAKKEDAKKQNRKEEKKQDAKEQTKKEEKKGEKKPDKKETEPNPKIEMEDKKTAIGPLSEEETKMFAANFRAMSATSIFVGKLPEDATDEDLKKLHPSIRSIRRPITRKGQPTTFGFLNFANKEMAERALKDIKKKGVVKIRGQEVLVSENGNGQCHPPSIVDRRKLRIYGCPKFVTAEMIRASLPGCINVVLGDKDKGNAVEAVAVFRSSAETKKILQAQQTVTLNECVCALFYLNISFNCKQHERRKEKKLKKLEKMQKEDGAAASGSDDQDDSDMPADKIVKFKKENVKPQVQSAKKGQKRAAPQDSDDDDDEEKTVAAPTPKNKKVSLKSPQKTPLSTTKAAKKTPMRKGTPFKKAKTAA